MNLNYLREGCYYTKREKFTINLLCRRTDSHLGRKIKNKFLTCKFYFKLHDNFIFIPNS